MLRAEFQICDELGWNLKQSTPYGFVRNYLSQGVVMSGELASEKPEKWYLMRVKRRIQELCDFAIDNQATFVLSLPEQVAAAIVLSARESCELEGGREYLAEMMG